ncbi:hypothetical protein GCM10022251_66030 [Phytohabitans flavus]|uniref:Uncharacterized protein n=1 Tax=Phytohabitans flavus TaxID=1076124 RepID=A0A6F8Y9I4_9ACTN|nr:hypothetical protein Pflav_090930 [Phytohabitans flavus]
MPCAKECRLYNWPSIDSATQTCHSIPAAASTYADGWSTAALAADEDTPGRSLNRANGSTDWRRSTK